MELRIGITMRITNADGYDEPRDTIAHDWAKYISEAFPNAKFIFLPNIGEKAVDFIKEWDINVLIISGGDDIGISPLRDFTETALLKYAIEANIPVIAVCRGLQLAHTYFGGTLLEGDRSFVKSHRATEHNVLFNGVSRVVNSYHTNMIDESTLNKEFIVMGRCENDNSIEAFTYNNILALMWHPERDKDVSEWNKLLIEKFIKKIYGY